VTLLDEAMVAVTAGEVSALTAGGVYCSVLEACGEICDLQRAQEWTSALDRWCASQPDLVPYRGHCLVRRAELLQLHGAWPDALEGAQRASEWLLHPAPKPGVGSAFYQMGEVYRLRGKFAEAEEAYRQASQWYRSLGSGLALLRLAQGKVAEAETAICRALLEEQRPGPRARILDACVEIMLAGEDAAGAGRASKELAEIAGRQNTPFLRALSLRATGSVLLAEGDARGALAALRQSWHLWCDLQAPYEEARVRYLMALAFNRLGEEHEAAVELEAARETFLRLGASVDLAQVDALLPRDAPKGAGPLTDRELEVLRLVASGMTNRSIAGKLHISEKTVARHLSNIFMKLDLNSRTAAAAYAYDHNLV
jgi:ATP/maltotriose-dependent transcriptional regulator MalT